MKNNYYLPITVVFLVLLAGLNSCQKDVIDPQPKIPLTLIEQSKIHFEENVQSIRMDQGITTSGQRLTRKNSTRIPLWKEAYVRKISIGEAVIVPIHYSNTMYIKKGKEKQAVSLDNLTYLMIYKNKHNEMVTEVVSRLPDDEYWDYPKRNLKPFQGVAVIEDWQGNFLKAYQYFKGGGTVKINPVSNSAPKKKENKISAEAYWSICFQYVNNCTCSDKSNCDWCAECTQTDCYSGWTNDSSGGGDGGTSSGDYSGGGGGGSGGGGTTNPCGDQGGVTTSAAPCGGDSWDSSTIIVIPPDGQTISNITDYLKCFDLNQPAYVNVYVDQPAPGSSAAYVTNPVDPGHTFVSIQQGNLVRVIGFYPVQGVYPIGNPSEPSILVDDSGHDYDVKLTIIASGAELSAVVNYAKSYQSVYHLDKYNCTDFAIKIAEKAGVYLPDSYGTWPGGGGSNPGALGQYIRTLSSSTGATVKTTPGYAISNQGGC